MKTNFSILTLLFIFICSSISFSQTGHFCGYKNNAHDTKRIHKNLNNPIVNKSGEMPCVPIQFFIVSNESGFGGVDESRVFDAFCNLKSYFDSVGIQFILKDEFIYLSDQSIYAQEESGGGGSLEQFVNYKDSTALNIFIGGPIGSNSVYGYYAPIQDVVYMDKNFIKNDDVVLAHEVGHFLSLRHTFSGWENTIYNPNEETPTEILLAEGYLIEVELVDRSKNCSGAADLLCDTPADYILGWNECNYNGGAVDPEGVKIDPDERNIMAYYTGCSEYIFSEGQKELMITDVNNRQNLMQTNDTLMQMAIEEPIVISPNEGDIVFDIDNTYFEWEEVENAYYYVFELSFSSDFTTKTKIYTTETSVTGNFLFDGFTYYWRVKALSLNDPCNPSFSETIEFVTDIKASINDEKIDIITLSPNPNSGELLQLQNIEPEKIKRLDIVNLNGKVVARFGKTFSNQLDLPELDSGVYIVNIESQGGLFTQKLVIDRSL